MDQKWYKVFPSICTLGFSCFLNASAVPAISEDCICYLILLFFYPFPFSKGDKRVHNSLSHIINRVMDALFSFLGMNLYIMFAQN